MTGPRFSSVRPRDRRGRRLLPLFLAVMLSPLGCSSDQPTEPAAVASSGHVAAATGSHPRPVLAAARVARTNAALSAASKLPASFSFATAGLSTGPSVLILADTDVVSTTALANSLAGAGVQVTLRPAPEYTWDGTNPSLNGFDVVIHLDGETYDSPLPSEAQTALTSFVQNGGGFVGAKWDGYEVQPELSNLVLQGVGGDPSGPEKNCGACLVTYEALAAAAGHPVLAGIPSSFTFMADAHDAGPQTVFASEPSTVLMQVSTGGPAVLVRQFGAGRVVNFSFAPNYPFNDLGDWHDPETLQDSNIQKLYLNAVVWAAGSGTATAEPQTITFAALGDETYGDAPFSISASASSNLPVSFTAAGDCSVLGTSVTISAVGSCTITAHQAGNDAFAPADDVSQSFSIVKGPAILSLAGSEAFFDGTTKSVTVQSVPAGLAGISVSYTQGGSTVAPVDAGIYQVLVTLDNPEYQATPLSGTLTIHPATPLIQWLPAPLMAGTPLGQAQLNATATGIGGAALSGTWIYTPAAGTVLSAGTTFLWAQFTPSSPNYAQKASSISLTVSPATTPTPIDFTGFFAPVNNMPSMNSSKAGSAIPLKFTITGYNGNQVLKTGSPSSMPIQCTGGSAEMGPAAGNVGTLQRTGNSYMYVWKTNASWAGSCRKFVLTLADGSTHKALFRFAPEPKALNGKRK
jgi:type 1 glutamine amidotransferase